MKTILRQLTVFIIGVIVILTAGYFIGGDRYMPWTEKETYYVVLHHAEATPLKNGRYLYETQAITAQGERKILQFETAHNLADGTFLKILSKGNYTQSTEPILRADIPTPALKKLY